MAINWTTATALAGFALGVWNAWRLERRSSVQLIVRPQFGGHDYGADPTLMRVRVANLSAFPVTRRRVSLVFRDEAESYCPCDLGPPENRLPRTLDPREAAVFELSVREAIAGMLHQYDHILRCQNVRSHDGQGRRIRDTAFVTRDIYVISPAQLDEAKSTHAGIPLAGAVAALAERDDLVAHALGIVNTSQFGWPQIYDIIELLTLDLIVQRRWATRAEIRDARQTANAHRHSGSQKSYPLPEHPPSLHEARRLLWSVLGKWIRERLQADPSSD